MDHRKTTPTKHPASRPSGASSRRSDASTRPPSAPSRDGAGSLVFAVVLAAASGACATVRPEQRAVLADPVMQFDGDASDQAARQHVLENREGSTGGGSVRGGGCGCN